MKTWVTSAEAFRPYTDAKTFSELQGDRSLCGMWQRCTEKYADREALRCGTVAVTYAGLAEEAGKLRGVLSEAGIRPGDRIALQAPNSIAFATGFWAAVTAGCTVAVLPPHLQPAQVLGCAAGFRAGVILCPEDKLPAFGEAADNAVIPIEKGKTFAGEVPPVHTAAEEDPCVIMFTGGTTGKSKGALLSHRAVMQGTLNGCYGLQEVFCQRYLLVLPLSHVFGLIRNMLTSFYTGSSMMICQNPQNMFRDIAVFHPTVLVLVPALAEMALSLSRKFGKNMLGPDMKTMICGAAPVPPYLIREYDAMGIHLYPGYGLTESANLVSGNPEPLRKPDSVGIPFPNQEIGIAENGELLLRGSNMLTAYEGTEERAWSEDGWFHTGDLGRMDEDGFLYITGRIKEIIVLENAENISPAELEARFNELPFVQDSQVFEDVNEAGRHILALEVVLRAAETGKLGENPKKAAEEKLWEVNLQQRPAERVSKIVIRDKDFERSPSMKIIRYKKV